MPEVAVRRSRRQILLKRSCIRGRLVLTKRRTTVSGTRVWVPASQESVSFEDVAVNFTSEEWALLNSSQKRLHRDVMQETFRNLAAIAKKQEDKTLEDDYEDLRNILPIAVQTGYKLCENQEYAEKPGVYKEHEKVFSSLQGFLEQVKTHVEEKTYECKQTEEGFSGHSDVQVPEKPGVLKQSGKDFLTLADIQQHITHNGHGPYICKVCGKAFHSSSSFLTHRRTHTGEQLYTCKQCGKTFTYSSGLRRHERTHSGEKPYECKQFLKVFPSLSKVESHEQTNNGIEYICNQCGIAFSDHNSLQCHEKIHSLEKPYIYKQCGKAFTCSSALRRHERIHTGVKPYECK
ncbi:hypothetical protein STEG23_008208, partial [Scotinomys teguina]